MPAAASRATLRGDVVAAGRQAARLRFELLRFFAESVSMAAPDANPFKMPTDEEVFALRTEEQQRSRQEREKRQQQRVWEKGVKSRPPVRDYEGERSERRLTYVCVACRAASQRVQSGATGPLPSSRRVS